MTKEKYLVMSDAGGDEACYTSWCDRASAEADATEKAVECSMGCEYAVYEKVGVTETRPAEASFRPIEGSSNK